jgi:hypothetical protein
MLVKAEWKVGYPSGKSKKIYNPGDKFQCSKEWGKKKAENGKVKILKEEILNKDIPVKELKNKAKELSIKGYSKMKKQDLLKAIKEKLDE